MIGSCVISYYENLAQRFSLGATCDSEKLLTWHDNGDRVVQCKGNSRRVASDEAVQEWIAQYPGTDTQQLRALVRQARKDAVPADKAAVSQGLAPRQGRAYREVFQLVKATLKGSDSSEAQAEENDDE